MSDVTKPQDDRTTTLIRLATVISAFAALSGAVLGLLYLLTGAWQNLALLVLSFLSAGGVYYAGRLARRGSESTAVKIGRAHV